MEIQAAILLVIVFFLMLAFSVPVSYSIIVSALVTIVAFLTPGFGVFVSAQKMVSGIDSFSLIAVPFFILAGLLMNSGGIAKRLINLALLVLGKVPGSLALTNIAGNAMFGSISGSGIAAATAIGGLLAASAMILKQELLLVVIGGVFVMELLSVVIQVTSYKATKKRVFRMAPLHHHFELGGMKETQVVLMFWSIGVVLAALGLWLGVM